MGILTAVKPAEPRTVGASSATGASRRAFLKATATAGGGLLLQACCHRSLASRRRMR